ncbi:hypothetical protein N657DRAFT_684082 [Parathielavia appendiculata]|uniref:Chromo domain-containing protein n=1 Tax=Parathielavia appendiculata TaxID=2587402 RepID=A0AAN6TTD5_9PEZI|nr:hypothetical protein N657DRAFT_684082 [Parathielavia appendiculata]
MLRNVLVTWPEEAPIVKWLSDAVAKSFRKVKWNTETEKGLLTKLRPPSPLELSALAPKTQDPSPAASGPPRGAAQPLTNWRLREDSSSEMPLFDIEVGGGLYWVKEEDAHRNCKRQLLKFWNDRGGRDEVIKKAGCAITKNTKFPIHDLLKESSDGSKFRVEWVGYEDKSRSWEPASEIDEKVIHAFRQRRLRRRV